MSDLMDTINEIVAPGAADRLRRDVIIRAARIEADVIPEATGEFKDGFEAGALWQAGYES